MIKLIEQQYGKYFRYEYSGYGDIEIMNERFIKREFRD